MERLVVLAMQAVDVATPQLSAPGELGSLTSLGPLVVAVVGLLFGIPPFLLNMIALNKERRAAQQAAAQAAAVTGTANTEPGFSLLDRHGRPITLAALPRSDESSAAAAAAIPAPPMLGTALPLNAEQERYLRSFSWAPGCAYYYLSRALALFYVVTMALNFTDFIFERALLTAHLAEPTDMLGLGLYPLLVGGASFCLLVLAGQVSRRRRWERLRWRSFDEFKANEAFWHKLGLVGWAAVVVLSVLGLYSYFTGVYAGATAVPPRIIAGPAEVISDTWDTPRVVALEALQVQRSEGDWSLDFLEADPPNADIFIDPQTGLATVILKELIPVSDSSVELTGIFGTCDAAIADAAIKAGEGSFEVDWTVDFTYTTGSFFEPLGTISAPYSIVVRQQMLIEPGQR